MHKWSSRKRWGVYLPFAHCICLYADLHCNEPADMNAFLHPTTCWVQGERDVPRCWTNCLAHGCQGSRVSCERKKESFQEGIRLWKCNCFGQFGFTQAFSVFLPRKKPRQLFTTGLIARIKKYSCCFQMAMIGVCGNVVAQTVSNATKILTAAIVPEVANVPLPSRSVGGGCCCRCWFCFVSLFQTRGFMLVLWKSFSVARDAHFYPSPVIERSNPPKSDHGDPCHDFCLIKVQCMWSCVRTFLFCFFAVLQTCWSGIAFLVKPVPHLQFVNFPCPAADQKRRWMHLIFLVSLNEPKTSIFFF